MLTPSTPPAFDVQRAIDTCLDEAALRAHLEPVLAPGSHVVALRVSNARRSASRTRHPTPLVFCCDVDLPGGAAQRWLGKVHREGASAPVAAADARTRHVAELELVLWPWPHDPALPHLAGLLDGNATVRHWGQTASAVDVLRYIPEQRALLRYTRADGARVFAKTYADDRAAAITRRARWMWSVSQRDDHAARVARPLDGDDPRTVWLDAVSGTPLRTVLSEGDEPASDLMRAFASALAGVHAAPRDLAGAHPRDTAHWVAEIERRRKKVGRVCPERTAQVDVIAAALTRAAASLVPGEPCVIHGDCHLDQAWCDEEGRIVLFDFDEFTLGDPMEDLAEFIAKLPDELAAAHVGEWLVEAYAQAAPQRFGLRRLTWHLAIQQLLQASRAFIFQPAGWDRLLRERLDRAEHFVARLDVDLSEGLAA